MSEENESPATPATKLSIRNALTFPPAEQRPLLSSWWLWHFVHRGLRRDRNEDFLFYIIYCAAFILTALLIALHWVSYAFDVQIPLGVTIISASGPSIGLAFAKSLTLAFLWFVYPCLVIYGIALALVNLNDPDHDPLWRTEFSLNKNSNHGKALRYHLLMLPIVLALPFAFVGPALWLQHYWIAESVYFLLAQSGFMLWLSGIICAAPVSHFICMRALIKRTSNQRIAG